MCVCYSVCVCVCYCVLLCVLLCVCHSVCCVNKIPTVCISLIVENLHFYLRSMVQPPGSEYSYSTCVAHSFSTLVQP